MRFFFLTFLVFFIGVLPLKAVFKYNESGNTHVVDGSLHAESLSARTVQADEIRADSFFGNGGASVFGPGITNITVSAGGWNKAGNLIQLDDINDEVLIGLDTGTGNKLSIAGDLNIKGGALKVDKFHTIGPGAADPLGGGLFFPNPQGSLNNSLSFRSRKSMSFGTDFGVRDFIWTKGANPLNPSQEMMRLKFDGRLGIFISNPTERLQVNGTVKANKFFGDGSGLTGLVANGQHPSFQCFTGTTTCGPGGFVCVQASLNGKPVSCGLGANLTMCCKVVLT